MKSKLLKRITEEQLDEIVKQIRATGCSIDLVPGMKVGMIEARAELCVHFDKGRGFVHYCINPVNLKQELINFYEIRRLFVRRRKYNYCLSFESTEEKTWI